MNGPRVPLRLASLVGLLVLSGCTPWHLTRWSNAQLRGMAAEDAGEYEAAREAYRAAVGHAAALDPATRAASLEKLAIQQFRTGRFQEADASVEALLARARALHPGGSPETAALLLFRLQLRQLVGDWPGVAEDGQAYLELASSLPGGGEPGARIQVLAQLAGARNHTGRLAEARELLAEAASLAAAQGPELAGMHVDLLAGLAHTQEASGRLADATRTLSAALAALEGSPPAGESEASATARRIRLRLHRAELHLEHAPPDPAACVADLEAAATLWEGYGSLPVDPATSAADLPVRLALARSRLAWDRGDLPRAREEIDRALEHTRDVEPVLGGLLPRVLVTRATLAFYDAPLEEAAAELARALPRTHEVLDGEPVALSSILAHVAVTLATNGAPEAAAPLAEEALELRGGLEGPHARSSAADRALALAELARGDTDAATARLTAYRQSLLEIYPEDHWRLAPLHRLEARVALARGDAGAALRATRGARRVLGEKLPAEHPGWVEVLALESRALLASGETSRALARAEEARALARRVLPEGHPDLAEVLEARGAARRAQGHEEDAAADLARAADLRRAAREALTSALAALPREDPGH